MARHCRSAVSWRHCESVLVVGDTEMWIETLQELQKSASGTQVALHARGGFSGVHATLECAITLMYV